MEYYITFPRGWTGRPKKNMPISDAIKNQRIFNRLSREPYQTVRLTRKNIKNLKSLRTALSNNNSQLSRDLNKALRTLESNYNRKVAAVKKIETAYKNYLSKHRSNQNRQRRIAKSRAVSKLVGTVAAKRLATRYLTGRAVAGYTYNWNKVMAEMNNTRPKTSTVPKGFTGKNKYERARVYKNRIIQWARTHPKKYDRPLYRGVQDKEALMFLTQSSVSKPNLSSFSKKLREAKFFSYSTPASLKINSDLKRISVILRYSPTDAVPSINLSRNGNFTGAARSEEEVLLVPGTFVIKKREYESKDTIVIDVDYK